MDERNAPRIADAVTSVDEVRCDAVAPDRELLA